MREASTSDRADVLSLLARTLGWRDDPRHQSLFGWKHDENVFGASPAWIARDGERLVGFRTFLRWEFVAGERSFRAVRAVDTATDPDYRGRGVFRRLTLHALREMQAGGVEFVFNTPNEQSRPGYLQMGWRIVGRLRLAARPSTAAGLMRMAGARVPAELWSVTADGEPVHDVLEDGEAVSELLASRPPRPALATKQSVKYLRWRYGFVPLDYRAVVRRGGVAAGFAIFRVRPRGRAREAVLCELFAPAGDREGCRSLVREVVRAAHADYVVRIAGPGDGCVPLPGQGPMLTWRPLASEPDFGRRAWDLTLGDVELF